MRASTFAAAAVLVLAAVTQALAGKEPRVGPDNPCLEDFQWYPEKRICARKLAAEEPSERAKCRPGSRREVKRDGRTVVQVCGFVK